MECKFIRVNKFEECGIDSHLYDVDGEVLAFSIVDESMWPDMKGMVAVWRDFNGSLIPVSVVRGSSIGDGVNNFIKQKYGE